MDLIAKAVTLKSIKLNDPTAKTLLFSAKHAVLYNFDSLQSNWEKTETEGCLAIYKRSKQHSTDNNKISVVLFILNRLRPENFSCPLNEIQSVQLEGDLLMLLLKNSQVMGIWLFDEKERQLALNVLQTILSNSVAEEDDDEEETIQSASNTTNLKPISVTDLLGIDSSPIKKKEKSPPSILDLLAKAKIKESTTSTTETATTLESAISEKFKDLSPSASLKSFTNSVCQYLQSNPQLLASLHRDLINHK